MAESDAPGAGAGRSTRYTSGEVPFWVHQVVDMLLAVLVMAEGARDGKHTAVLVGLGATLLLSSLVSDGALGAWALIGRRTHRGVDLLLAAAFAAAPLVFAISDVLPIAVLEGTALLLVWLSLRTAWTKRAAPRLDRGGRFRHRMPPPPVVVGPRPEPNDTPVARRLGAAVGKARADGPGTAGRVLGRAIGRLRSRKKKPS